LLPLLVLPSLNVSPGALLAFSAKANDGRLRSPGAELTGVRADRGGQLGEEEAEQAGQGWGRNRLGRQKGGQTDARFRWREEEGWERREDGASS
jgi:hypothetical protein